MIRSLVTFAAFAAASFAFALQDAEAGLFRRNRVSVNAPGVRVNVNSGFRNRVVVRNRFADRGFRDVQRVRVVNRFRPSGVFVDADPLVIERQFIDTGVRFVDPCCIDSGVSVRSFGGCGFGARSSGGFFCH